MGKLKQIQFALQDFFDNIKWVILICIGLSVSMVALSFVLNILIGYESSRIPALNEYSKNDLVKVTMVDTPFIENEKEVASYILSYIDKNSDFAMLSFSMQFNDFSGQVVFVGLGHFEAFYGINGRPDEVTYTVFGESQYSNEIKEKVQKLEKPLQYISSHGRALVIPMSELFITGTSKEIERLNLVSFTARSLLENFLFVNADSSRLDSFLREINSISPSLVVFTENMNELLYKNVINQSLNQLLAFAIIAIMVLLGTYLTMVKIIMYINDKNIKSFTVHYFSGALLSDIYLRSFLLNLIVIGFSAIGAVFVLYTLNLLEIWKYVLIQALIYCALFPIVPLVRIRKLNLYDNLRGDFDEKKD